MRPYYRVTSDESIAAKRIETLEGAQTRAEELAAKYPGRSFEILRCVGVASTSKASTFWMDGEGPPEKPRWRALENGETFQAGDQFLWCGEWTPVPNYSFGLKLDPETYECPHRRPL